MKPVFIFDATPLIHFAKIKLLEKTAQLKSRNIIPTFVYEELIEKYHQPETQYIQRLIDKKIFEIQSSKTLPKKEPKLSLADREVLILAKELHGIALLDDRYARRIAQMEGIENHGSIYLLLLLLRGQFINREETRNAIDAMIRNGWYCSTDLYATILQELYSAT